MSGHWWALSRVLMLALFLACSPGAPTAELPSAGDAPPGQPAPRTAAGAPAAGAAPAGVESALLKVTDLPITPSAANYIAAAKGYFREEGIQVEFARITGPDMVPLLVSNQVDVGVGGISGSLLSALARGIPVKIVADHGANLPDASAGAMVIRKDLVASGVYQRAADLRNRKISIPSAGSSAEVVLDRFLATGGLTRADVEIVLVSVPDVTRAFENRRIDAAYYQEPFTTIALDRELIVRGPTGFDIYPYQQTGILLFGGRLLEDRGLGLRYMRAYVRGVRDYVKALQERDPVAFDEIVPILIEHTAVKQRTLFEKAIPSGLKYDPIPSVQSMVDDQEWYVSHGYQTQRAEIQDIIDLWFVEQAIRDLAAGTQR
jgi:ABC-type nitrate/sulfonate/bicarbonate transport system substrate-binding protein